MCADSCRRCTGSTTRCFSFPSRWWRRSTATPSPAAACWPACADRRIMAREGGRIGVTELLVGVPFPALAFEIDALCDAAAIFAGSHAERRDLSRPTRRLQRGWSMRWSSRRRCSTAPSPRRETLAALSPAAFAQTKRQIRQPVIERMERSGAATDDARRRKSGPRRRRSAASATTSRGTLQES